jgi:hypothetical protein
MVDAERAKCGLVLLALPLALSGAVACRRSLSRNSESDAASSLRPMAAIAEGEGGAPRVEVSAPLPREVAPSRDAAPVATEPVGGRWVSCYANYRATSTPERDVARLAALCGPSNGMVPVGSIAAGDAVDAAEDHRLDARAGDCFRIFAVADAFVGDLGIEVINPNGKAITWDRNGDRWPILNPDGPFCLFDTGTYTVRVRALQGRGRYAMQVWRLPASP